MTVALDFLRYLSLVAGFGLLVLAGVFLHSTMRALFAGHDVKAGVAITVYLATLGFLFVALPAFASVAP